MSAWWLEVNIQVVDQGATGTKELETNKKKKNPEESTPITWKSNVSLHSQHYCFLEGRVTNQFKESISAFNIYKQTINLNLLIEIIVQQNWMKFLTNAQEMKVLICVNYFMTGNQLPSIPMFWDCNHFVGNVGIQNIFARPRNQVVFQNNHFADNTKQNKKKTDKGQKLGIIDHLNELFQAVCIEYIW